MSFTIYRNGIQQKHTLLQRYVMLPSNGKQVDRQSIKKSMNHGQREHKGKSGTTKVMWKKKIKVDTKARSLVEEKGVEGVAVYGSPYFTHVLPVN